MTPETCGWRAASDSAHFRHVLGHYPTGVVVVTTIDDGQLVGFTIGSFTSVSLDPPMVGFLPTKSSSTWGAIERSGMFCVNVLASDQPELCWKFARADAGIARYEDVEWELGPSGSPVLQRALASIDCTVEDVFAMGDHYFVLGRVTALRVALDRSDAGPLVFCRGALGRFAAVEA